MKNPYEVLNIPQNATKSDIIKGKMTAMKERNFSLQEIQLAEKNLLNPSKRLISDFLFPSKIKAKRPKLIKTKVEPSNIRIEDMNVSDLDSLKY